jgi:hypothetical protein
MKNNKKTIATLALMSAIITTFGIETISSASFGGFGLLEEQRENVKIAIKNNDYDSWKVIMDSRVQITDVITEENFDKYSEMHNLVQEGNFEEADVLREELGLSERGLRKEKSGVYGMRERNEDKNGFYDTGTEAIEANNYDAWKEIIGDTRMSEVIENEDDFSVLVKIHGLVESGEIEAANELKEELGLESKNGHRASGMSGGRMGGKWQGRIK